MSEFSRRDFLKSSGALISTLTFSGIPGFAKGSNSPFKIGTVYYAYTGSAVSLGQSILRSAKLAVEEVNNERGGILGGRPIELHGYDEGYSAEQGLSSVKKALADGCEAIVGFNDSTAGLAAQAYCRKRGIVLTTTGAGTPLLTCGSYPGYFRSGFMCGASDKARARWVEDMGFKKVVYLAVDSKYSIDALKDYRSVWDQPDSPVELAKVIWVPYGQAECKMETIKAANYEPDFIFTNTWGTSIVASLAKTLEEIGYKGAWTICYDVMMNYLVEAVGPAGDGSWHTFNWLPNPDVPENWEFYQAYKERNPDYEPGGFGESAYEGMWITALAIDKAGGVDDLAKYDEALQSIEWMTPRGVEAEILPNRESYQPEWSNAQLEWTDSETWSWANRKPMEVRKKDYFLTEEECEELQ